MIVPMKKVTVIVQAKDSRGCVAGLRALGVLHVEHQQPPAGGEAARLRQELENAGQALLALSARAGNTPPLQHEPTDWKAVVQRVIDLSKRLEQIDEFSQGLSQQITAWEPWGDFAPEDVVALRDSGIELKLYVVPDGELEKIPDAYYIAKIFSRQGMTGCCVVSHNSQVTLPYPEQGLPRCSLSAMRARLLEERAFAGRLDAELDDLTAFIDCVARQAEELKKQLVFAEALQGMGEESGLAYVRGYVPRPRTQALEQEARRRQWAIVIEDPAESEEPPTLLVEPRWVSIIKPLLNLLGVVPGYRELDVSMTFLVFFSIFFGILIGDAGYGVSYLMLTKFVLSRKLGDKHRSAIVLMYVLSFAAIVWGVLTGTFFGQAWILAKGYRPPAGQLNDVKFFQAFCFFLGAVHLSIAHGWRTVLKLPSVSALADVGWMSIVWAAFFLARTLILGDPFPGWVNILIYGGITLVVFFTNPQRNMLKSAGEGLGTIALGLVNNFTDVVSYIRLFAVGMAGVAIGDATNTMAASVGSGAVAFIAAPLIVAVGHALNLVLGPMSVLVHGVRLNVLEFSGHASVTWSGRPYEPLKE